MRGDSHERKNYHHSPRATLAALGLKLGAPGLLAPIREKVKIAQMMLALDAIFQQHSLDFRHDFRDLIWPRLLIIAASLISLFRIGDAAPVVFGINMLRQVAAGFVAVQQTSSLDVIKSIIMLLAGIVVGLLVVGL